MSATVLSFETKACREHRERYNRLGRWMLEQHRINRQRKIAEEQVATSRHTSTGARQDSGSRAWDAVATDVQERQRPAQPAAQREVQPVADPSAKRIAMMTLFEAVPAPHPAWRIWKVLLRVNTVVFGALRPVMSIYLLIVTTLCVPLALVARMWWLAAYCTVVGLVFARILLAELRQSPHAGRLAGRVARWLRISAPDSDQDDSGWTAQHYRVQPSNNDSDHFHPA